MPISNKKISYSDLTIGIIDAPPAQNVRTIVVIPSFAEEFLVPVLTSLYEARVNDSMGEIIIVINEGEHSEEISKRVNEQAFDELCSWTFSGMNIHVIYVKDIPAKIAGVGTARKIGMDEACHRFDQIGMSEKGVIVNLDVDCTVSPTYFSAIQDYFVEHPHIELANIHFEHDLQSCGSNEEKKAIIDYELHLRYFIAMQKWLGLPYAFQTIGSSFAVRSAPYQQVGGMNRRKAGEDFYFIHKFTKKGTVGNLKGCTVFPSSRPSFRVPFGTGKSVSKQLQSDQMLTTYNVRSFIELHSFVSSYIDRMYEDADHVGRFHSCLQSFLDKENFTGVVIKIRSNTKSKLTFEKAFFQWFDAFRLMKYLHHCRDHYFPNVLIKVAIDEAQSILELRLLVQRIKCLNGAGGTTKKFKFTINI